MRLLTPIRYAAFGVIAGLQLLGTIGTFITHPDTYNGELANLQCKLVGHNPASNVRRTYCDRCYDDI